MQRNPNRMLKPIVIKIVFFLCFFCAVYTLTAQPTNTIKGTVFYNDNVIEGVSVAINPQLYETFTDDKGFFQFKNLLPGKYGVKVTFGDWSEIKEVELTDLPKTTELYFVIKDTAQMLEEMAIIVEKEHANPHDFIKAAYSAMPVTVIDKRTIALMGSRRLDEVLKEQTGVAIVNNIGGGSRSVGVQVQGFGSEYIKVLIDGQPLMGRNNDNFDLSRISVATIERIEMVKGAASSLYGSEALGGTINIVTKSGTIRPQLLAGANYGSFNTWDTTLEGEIPFQQNKGSAYLGANYYHTDGFNTNTTYIKGVTSPPYTTYAGQFRIKYQLSEKTAVSAGIRYTERTSVMRKDFGTGQHSNDTQAEEDLNTSFAIEHRFSNRFRSNTRYYFTRYNTEMNVGWQGNAVKLAHDVFNQDLHQIDQQFSYKSGNRLELIGGFGGSRENMKNNQLTLVEKLYSGFLYTQGEWKINEKIKGIGGLRYDYTNQYSGRLNPSAGLHYSPLGSVVLKAGIGTGFKAPDFRKNYLVFFNAPANYYVIGNAVLEETIAEMRENGQISEVREYILKRTADKLEAEQSTSYNLSAEYIPSDKLKTEASVFYHAIRNQINSIQVATSVYNQNIYTYQNLPKVVNKGFDIGIRYAVTENFNASISYQYLMSKDLSTQDSIRAGKWPYNQNIHDPKTGRSYPPSVKDYWGIENRSRHMANLNLFYTHRPWDMVASFRINFRGKYPFGDRNGNHFIDRYDTFVEDHFLINASFEKKLLQQKLRLQLVLDNILDYTNPLMPGQPGRMIMIGVSYRFAKQEDKN